MRNIRIKKGDEKMKVNWFKSVEDQQIERIGKWMAGFDIESKEYQDGLKTIERLVEIKDKRLKNKVKPEIWVPAATSLLSILLVLNYEKLGVITSKAFSMIKKP